MGETEEEKERERDTVLRTKLCTVKGRDHSVIY